MSWKWSSALIVFSLSGIESRFDNLHECWSKKGDSPSPPNALSNPSPTTSHPQADRKHQVPPPLPQPPLSQGYNLTQDDTSQRIESSGQPRNSPCHNQLIHRLRNPTHETTQPKGQVSEEEEWFDTEGGGESAVQELEGGEGKEVSMVREHESALGADERVGE